MVSVTTDRPAKPLRLIPDTGTDSLVLFASPRTADGTNGGDRVSVSGLTGSRGARTKPAPRLIVGETELRSELAVVIERDADSDGLLPLHMFGSVSFNMCAGCIVVRER